MTSMPLKKDPRAEAMARRAERMKERDARQALRDEKKDVMPMPGRRPITQPGPMPVRDQGLGNGPRGLAPKGLMATLGVPNGAALDKKLANLPKTSGPIASSGTGVGPVNMGGLRPGLDQPGNPGFPDPFPDPSTRPQTPRTPLPPGGIMGALNKMAVNPTGAPTPGPNGFKKGGKVKSKSTSSYKSGGKTSSASKRGDGCAIKGKTKGRMI